MEYQVWTETEFEGWKKVDCEDIQAVIKSILEALMQGREPLLTAAIPYDFNIKIKEDKIGEAAKSKAGRSEDPGVEGKGKVRPGAPGSVPELGEGSRDLGPDNSVPGK